MIFSHVLYQLSYLAYSHRIPTVPGRKTRAASQAARAVPSAVGADAATDRTGLGRA